MNLQMIDAAEDERHDFIASMQRNESPWWWAVGIASAVALFMLAAYVGPVVFPAG